MQAFRCRKPSDRGSAATFALVLVALCPFVSAMAQQADCLVPDPSRLEPTTNADGSFVDVFRDGGGTAFFDSIVGSNGELLVERLGMDACGSRVDLSATDGVSYFAAIRNGAGLNILLGLSDWWNTIDDPFLEGVSSQIVEPQRAIDAYGGSGGGQWRERVEAAYPDVRKGQSTCQIAINELKALACGSATVAGCDVEDRYRSECVGASSRTRSGACVIAADNYFEHCFSGSRVDSVGLGSIALMCRGNDENYCTTSLVLQNETWEERALSANHCFNEGAGMIRPVRDGRELPFCQQTDTSSYASSDADEDWYLYSSDIPAQFHLQLQAPTLFEVTAAGGLNVFAVIRNQAAKAYNTTTGSVPDNFPDAFEIISEIRWDSSVLCTVVEDGSTRLTHTCQSSRGTSGGPILQSPPGGGPLRLVGINIGSGEVGPGPSNFGAAYGAFAADLAYP